MVIKMVHQAVSECAELAGDVTDAHDVKSSREPLHLESSWKNKCDVKGFLKRNAFVLLSVGAIAIGKSLWQAATRTLKLYIFCFHT